MINLAVINLKVLIKNIVKFITIIFLIILFIAVIKIIYYFVTKIDTTKIDYEKIIEENISISNYDMEKNNPEILKQILVAELSIFSDSTQDIINEEINNIDEISNNIESTIDNIDNVIEIEDIVENNMEVFENLEKDEIDEKVETMVIVENNIPENYTDIYQTVRIKNESNYVLTEKMVTPDFDVENKNDIIIYHTHTCESYTPSANYQYEQTGNYRTTNLDYSVVRVGQELANYMIGRGYNVIHDRTFHDYPAYTGSYSRSLLTVSNILNVHKNVDIVLDIHRDALGSNSNYAPSVQIGNEKVAQLMFVIGTDGGGLDHPNWNNNLKFAIKIQERANEMYPGLFRPIILRNSRYNQNVADGAVIIEVGATRKYT